jgi:hypothetical protein
MTSERLLKARSSSAEHCQHTAEVGGSIPSRAYQDFRGYFGAITTW